MLVTRLSVCACVIATAIASGALSGPVAAQNTSADPLVFRIASSYLPSNTVMASAQQALVSRLEELAGNSMAVKLLPPGDVVSNDKLLNAVGNGSVQAAFVDPASWAARDAGFHWFSGVPDGATAMEMLAWFDSGDAKRLFQQLHSANNVEALVCGAYVPAAGLWLSKPFAELGGFKDLNIHATGLGARLFDTLGAKTKIIRPSELQRSLELGVIDAVYLPELPLAEQIELLGKAATYYYPGGIGQQVSVRTLIVSRQIWEAMNKMQRADLQGSCDRLTLQMLARSGATEAQSMSVLKAAKTNAYRWDADSKALISAAWQTLAGDLSSQSDAFKAGWESVKKFLAGSKAINVIRR